jgi:hypothetical protein
MSERETGRQDWRTVVALICLRIRDNAWLYTSKEERKAGRG